MRPRRAAAALTSCPRSLRLCTPSTSSALRVRCNDALQSWTSHQAALTTPFVCFENDSRKLVYPALHFLLLATADQRGSARFVLQRTLGGHQIRVDVDCTPVPAEFDEDYDEEEEQQEEEEVRCSNCCWYRFLLVQVSSRYRLLLGRCYELLSRRCNC